MADLFTNNRAKFPSGEQKKFIVRCSEKLGKSNDQLAEFLNVSTRTITDWKREKFLMTMRAVVLLSKKSKIPVPENIKKEEPFWYARSGAAAGGTAVYRKYGHVGGNPENRKRKWREWWEEKGKFQPHPIINVMKRIKIPKKSADLAEFTGIVMGDGGITARQVTITLHHIDDEKYARFVVKLIKRLFGVAPKIYHDPKNSVNDLVVSRTALVNFCTEKLGLKIGNKIKQQIDIPDWIKNNKKFQSACVRGLVDTDGSLVIHKYKVGGKMYCYKKLDFCSASKPLIGSVIEILKKFDFMPRLSHNGRNVWIDDQNEVRRYFRIIGSDNPKHRERLLR